jgi:ABC-type spermidine/putrescine transport system permease subunit I
MVFSSQLGIAAAIAIMTVIINLPFGYFRKKTKKYSFKWFLYIHLPIPLIFLARVSSHLSYRYIPIFVAAAVTGQILGGKIEI